MSRLISDVESVGLHIRRGDYLSSINNSYFGTLNLSYYQKAIEFIVDKVDNPVFFIFSDDIPWAKENLKIPYPVYFMDQNDEEHGYEDMRLMNLCKHFIIANSSFSWWGAWLGAHQSGGYVLAPDTMHKNLPGAIQIPKSWMKIDSKYD